jgi:hypothetical protein
VRARQHQCLRTPNGRDDPAQIRAELRRGDAARFDVCRQRLGHTGYRAKAAGLQGPAIDTRGDGSTTTYDSDGAVDTDGYGGQSVVGEAGDRDGAVVEQVRDGARRVARQHHLGAATSGQFGHDGAQPGAQVGRGLLASDYYTWDPNTLAGTVHVTQNAAACGNPAANAYSAKIQLRQAP